MRATAIFPFAASRILFNEGEGREEEEKALVFRRPGSFFPLAAAGQDIRPRRKGAEEEGGWTHSRFDANRHNLSLSLSSPPLLFVLSENRRLHAPLRFPVIGFLELERRGEGDGYITLLQSLECFLVMRRPMFRRERGERERNSRRPGQRFRSTVGLFTGLFSRSLCYFI